MNAHSIFLLSLGCSKNTVDSERLIRQAQHCGFTFCDEAAQADIIIINTCGFIADAKQESINEILAAADLRRNGSIKALYVMGCLSALYSRELRAELPEVDRFFGTSDLEAILQQLGGRIKPDSLHERTLLTPPHYAWLKIAEGCSRTCSFCAIPKMRGSYHSQSVGELEKEALMLRERGVRELNLISQDITRYGWDLEGRSMLDELVRLLAGTGFPWIRLLYAYPQGFPLEVIDTMNSLDTVCNYLDMPVQHISDRILSSMNRGMNKAQTIQLLNRIRERNPDIRLRTTLITGYPGETREEFEELLRFVRELRFDRLGCFTYSHEEHTTAWEHLQDDIPQELKQERLQELMEVQESISAEKNRHFEGSRLTVLIDDVDGTTAFGRTEYDAPEVDNECIIDIGDTACAPGDFCLAEIIDTTAYELHGTAIRKL
ncbi:30S ribosomal protein S12 methylthiotransferase RimO [Prosthecochloris sp. N3]|uniref:Ribosomal protein uS12 methylthiotransferase RimO n=1 Tax=Prosthecochloris ethylica TaxID=2743976 RepID=A0ABR9XQN7_9CHLB|nr:MULTISPECIES: 30S ribosomal protein S12 methylthiotransferase RimO [Prosthecochloris]MEC9486775.1 30S ribosomal protein S12 methylthiotransferase RimO [Prosthecochloris sp.]MBF0585519.1 30S ribosomal protein S12 methylthiotransferase RimO [Prosthecochloris ethylica]MBF0636305.1 30S ribosomal protein S12 methylthiotransferase RimO [Prosthecochloris ethylica]NUK46749.1 30S ribosomal protein S12 methylthiotransferase RimO [Prosthecochloris ethylica]RNA64668.1 30S ribosomal protein S12 methylth